MKYIIFLILSLFVYSCNTDISTLPVKTVHWDELPEKVKTALCNSNSEPYINLDSSLYAVNYKNTSIVGLYSGKRKFYLNNGKCFYLNWNENKEVSPYVFYNKKIYYLFDSVGDIAIIVYDNEVHKDYSYKIVTIE